MIRWPPTVSRCGSTATSPRASGSARLGRRYWVQDENEVIYLLSGRMTVTPDGGEPAEVKAGDIAVFPTGWKGTWDIHETVRKVYSIF